MTDPVTLLVDGTRFSRWTDISITRGIDRTVSSFQFTAGDAGQGLPFLPFAECEVYIGQDKFLTGYVERIGVELDRDHNVLRVSGHSKTIDLTQCTPDVQSGQFAGATVASIARAICALFGIDVVVKTDKAGAVVQNTNLERGETAFRFLERLGNLSGVLLSDDENGNLVLQIAGDDSSDTLLEQGRNLERIHGDFDGSRRFSDYIVKGQAGIALGNALNLDGEGGVSAEAPTGDVQTSMRAAAADTGVPRYRPHVSIAESQLTPAQMKARAEWQKRYSYGQSIKVDARLPGFRQESGELWRPNLLVPVLSPRLTADLELLVASVTFTLSPHGGGVTDLRLGPIEGYTPDPGSVRASKVPRGKKGRGGKGDPVDPWKDVV